jgi:hypothetical protein
MTSKFNLMGRVDLTSEINPYKPDKDQKDNTFKNNHFLIFLKVKASRSLIFLNSIRKRILK